MTALVRLDGSGGGQRLDVFPGGCTGPLARMERFRDYWIWRGFRSSAAGVLGSAIGMDRTLRSDCCRWPRFQWCLITCAPSRLGKGTEGYSAQRSSEVQVSGVRETGDTGIFVGMTKVHSREELAPALNLASELRMKILVERAIGTGIEVAVLETASRRPQSPEKLFRTASFTITRLNI